LTNLEAFMLGMYINHVIQCQNWPKNHNKVPTMAKQQNWNHWVKSAETWQYYRLWSKQATKRALLDLTAQNIHNLQHKMGHFSQNNVNFKWHLNDF